MINKFLDNFNEISFHMPGHKGRIPFNIIDITEIPGSDNLMEPTGMIKDSQELMAKKLNKDEVFYLTNGASSGILASILALTSENDTVLVDRNCHISVINGIIMSGAMPKFIYPTFDNNFGIPKPITKIDYNNEKMVIVTTPTYYGDVSNIKNLKSQIGDGILLCDEAHGSHFYFSDNLKTPYNADLSVLGFHKTLPTLNQGGVLCVNGMDKKMTQKIKQCLNMVTTTSPSYPILSSLDYSRIHGDEIYNNSQIIEKISELRNLNLKIHTNDDFYKLLINFKYADEVHKHLVDKYNIYPEGVFGDNVLFMLSPYNTLDELEILKQALISIPYEYNETYNITLPQLDTVISPKEAFYSDGETVLIKNAVGRIAKENIVEFPPCVPIVTMGEKITKEILPFIKREYLEVVK